MRCGTWPEAVDHLTWGDGAGVHMHGQEKRRRSDGSTVPSPKPRWSFLAGELGVLPGRTRTLKPVLNTKKCMRTRCKGYWLVYPMPFYQDGRKLWAHVHEKRVGTEAKRISLEMKHNCSQSLPILGHCSIKMAPAPAHSWHVTRAHTRAYKLLAPSSAIWPGTLYGQQPK